MMLVPSRVARTGNRLMLSRDALYRCYLRTDVVYFRQYLF
jgi:hypothetical protein